MSKLSKQHLIIFSDLDGCLLNKADYSYAAAVPTLQRVRRGRIPLVLASSKTEPEMRRLADEMELDDAPLICENGGVIFWSRGTRGSDKTVLGVDRELILNVLAQLKSKFSFESFADLQVEGIMRATDLPRDRAEMSLQRSCTEPLLWHDTEDKLPEFRNALMAAELTLTRGGRFWHIAGQTNKGAAMQAVQARIEERSGELTSIAIGDSPIDQSMLDVADYPIGIPTPDGTIQVEARGETGRVASLPGAAGWAEAVGSVLDELC